MIYICIYFFLGGGAVNRQLGETRNYCERKRSSFHITIWDFSKTHKIFIIDRRHMIQKYELGEGQIQNAGALVKNKGLVANKLVMAIRT